MSWLLSIFISGFIFTNSTFPDANFAAGSEPQVVVSNPQAVLEGDETEKIEKTFPLNSNGKISVDNVNGSIVIDAWDRNEVKLEAVKIADSRERLSQVEIVIDAKPEYLRIETEFGRNRSWNCSGYCRLEVQYKLTVPRGAVLNNIETVNGSVTISNTTNFTKASAVNGKVKAVNLQGTAEVETVNGVSEISFEKLSSNSKIKLATVNGRVNLVIPSDADATIKADSLNGSISNDFNLPVRKGKYVGRDLHGKLGDGTVKINLESVNGGLSIKRMADGKSPKAVTNLLNMKEDADDEDEIDVVTEISPISKMNKDISKAVKESTKLAVEVAGQTPEIVEQALKDAEKALAENSKEIARAQREAERIQRNAERNAERIQRDAERMERDFARSYNQTYGQNFAGDFGFNANRIEEVSDTIEVKGIPKVTIDARKCAVSVRGWDNNEVKYRVIKKVRGAIQPDVEVNVSKSDTQVTINALVKGQKATSPDGKNIEMKDDFTVFSENAVRIEVFVPKKSNLRILTDKEIRVEGVTGNIDLNGADSAINVRDSEGKLKLTAGDALVRVLGFTGDVDSTTGDGTNFFEGDFAKFSAKTADGKIILTLPEETDADIQTNTEIRVEGFSLSETGKENVRRIGLGGKTFNLNSENGEVFLRSAKIINTK